MSFLPCEPFGARFIFKMRKEFAYAKSSLLSAGKVIWTTSTTHEGKVHMIRFVVNPRKYDDIDTFLTMLIVYTNLSR